MAPDDLNAEELLRSAKFAEAVTSMKRRAEKQDDLARLADIYVLTDLPIRCSTTDHQLILGRRGTGKTHLLRYFQYQKQIAGQVVHYCDSTRLGSGLNNSSSDPTVVALKYFLALLSDLTEMLLEQAVRLEAPSPGVVDRILFHLSEVGAASRNDHVGSDSVVNYRKISTSLEAILSELEITRLFLVLDEWAQVPLAAQPYLAEYLKRAILTVPSVSLKLVAVNYLSRFSVMQDGNLVGLQRGADITDVIDIDTYFIFDENRTLVVEFFGQLLYNHLGAELGWALDVETGAKVRGIQGLFTQDRAFIELVRAAEGNSRDFISIFNKAYFEGYKPGESSKTISIPQINSAAGSWYLTEKEANIGLEPDAKETISFLMDTVLKGYKSRSFLVEAGKEEHPRLVRLLNERILHRLNQVYSHKDRPGLRYEILTLDYGAYVRYKGTSLDPHQATFIDSEELAALDEIDKRIVVPLDDKRSIRRIVFDPDRLDVNAG